MLPRKPLALRPSVQLPVFVVVLQPVCQALAGCACPAVVVCPLHISQPSGSDLLQSRMRACPRHNSPWRPRPCLPYENMHHTPSPWYNTQFQPARKLNNAIAVPTLPFPPTPTPPGDEEPGIIPADIVFVLDEKPHPRFRRDGDNLHHTAVLPLADALCGTTLQVGLGGRGAAVCGEKRVG